MKNWWIEFELDKNRGRFTTVLYADTLLDAIKQLCANYNVLKLHKVEEVE